MVTHADFHIQCEPHAGITITAEPETANLRFNIRNIERSKVRPAHGVEDITDPCSRIARRYILGELHQFRFAGRCCDRRRLEACRGSAVLPAKSSRPPVREPSQLVSSATVSRVRISPAVRLAYPVGCPSGPSARAGYNCNGIQPPDPRAAVGAQPVASTCFPAPGHVALALHEDSVALPWAAVIDLRRRPSGWGFHRIGSPARAVPFAQRL